MAKQIINIGRTANDRSGDPLRTAFDKVNTNFTELYPQAVPTTSKGSAGDVEGMVAFDSTYFYYCVDAFDGTADIWKRQTHSVGTW